MAISAPTAALATSLGIDPTDPSIAGALNDIAAQATAEGEGSALEIGQRQATLLHSFSDIYSRGTTAAQDALTAAKAYVGQNHTIAGAIDTASGLVSAVDAASHGASPAALVTDFTGPLMGTLVLSGALTAGAGAAITGIVAAAGALLDALHVFGDPPPPGQNICGSYVNPPPDYVIGCAYYDDSSGPQSPDSPYWRRFPEPANVVDAATWFSINYQNNTLWRDAHWGGHIGQRLIDSAFPDYTHVSMLTSTPPTTLAVPGTSFVIPVSMLPEDLQTLYEFERAYFTAWKANKEYWLNGRKGGTDAQVLEQAVRIWNRAHLPGKGTDVYPDGPMYYTTQIKNVASNNAHDFRIVSKDSKGIHLNTGPLQKKVKVMPAPIPIVFHSGVKPAPKPAPIPIVFHSGVKPVTQAASNTLATHQAAAGANPTTMPIAEKVGIGAAAAAVVGGLAWWLL